MSCYIHTRKITYIVTGVTLEPPSHHMLLLHVSSKLLLTISLLKAVYQSKYCIIDALHICSAACHISAHFLCACVEGEVSSSLEGDVIKEKLSNNVIIT